MIKSVTVINHLGESLKMDLFKPEESGLLITNIDGIGAPDAEINLTDYAIADGSHFSSARANARTITFKLTPLFHNGQSVESSRQLTYRFFPIRHKVTLQFETEKHTLEIEGYVKQNDPTIFASGKSPKPESIAIVVQCPDPWFYLLGRDTNVVFSGVDPCFEFPFANNKIDNDIIAVEHVEYDEFGRVIRRWTEYVVVENSKGLLKMGEVSNTKQKVINYDGEIEIGFVCTIQTMKNDVTDILIWKQETSEFISIITSKISDITGSPFAQGDMIKISTVSGNRYLKIIRGNGETNIINALDLNSSWIQLTSGANTLWYACATGVDDIKFKIEYKEAYQGV